MNKETFLLDNRIKEIKTLFIKDGWVTIFEKDPFNETCRTLIFCCLVDSKRLKNYQEHTDWVIGPEREGKPAIITYFRKGKSINTYETYSDKGFEPFIFAKNFSFDGGYDSYVDISEEFILYFKLYEKGNNKQNRKFYFIDEAGDLDEVITIDPNKIKVKLKYLKEYISIRKMNFSICFDFQNFWEFDISKEDIKLIDETFQDDNFYYKHYIESVHYIRSSMFQSLIHGKVIIKYDKNKTNTTHYGNENRKYESFIVGYDEEGNEKLLDCRRTNEKYFILTYFKKEVLNKYYNEPNKYEVKGMSVSSKFFTLEIDNNIDDYVAVFLIRLCSLPYKEQLHWKQYNIPPQNGLSSTFYNTMFKGSWGEKPQTPDLFFKAKYKQFNKAWHKKFGWNFYKELSKEDKHRFTSLHIPTTNNIKAFCEQILSLVIITIDSLNEKEIAKGLVLEENDKGIKKLDKFLKSKDIELPDMMDFLRNLQDIRSGLIAHRFSSSNKNAKKAINYFGIKDNNLIEVANEIFIKSVFTLNTLEKIFILNEAA